MHGPTFDVGHWMYPERGDKIVPIILTSEEIKLKRRKIKDLHDRRLPVNFEEEVDGYYSRLGYFLNEEITKEMLVRMLGVLNQKL